MIDLQNENLEELELAIAIERNRRMTEALRAKKNVAVVTLQSGFSGGPGVPAYCVGECKAGEPTGDGSTWGDDYFLFSDWPNGKSMWLVPPHRVGAMLRLAYIMAKAKVARPRAYTADEARDIILQTVADYVDYWENETRRPTSREKLEGLAFSIMVIFDGGAGMLPGFIVKPNPHESDKDYSISQGDNWWDPKTDIAGSLHENIHKFFKK